MLFKGQSLLHNCCLLLEDPKFPMPTIFNQEVKEKPIFVSFAFIYRRTLTVEAETGGVACASKWNRQAFVFIATWYYR